MQPEKQSNVHLPAEKKTEAASQIPRGQRDVPLLAGHRPRGNIAIRGQQMRCLNRVGRHCHVCRSHVNQFGKLWQRKRVPFVTCGSTATANTLGYIHLRGCACHLPSIGRQAVEGNGPRPNNVKEGWLWELEVWYKGQGRGKETGRREGWRQGQ